MARKNEDKPKTIEFTHCTDCGQALHSPRTDTVDADVLCNDCRVVDALEGAAEILRQEGSGEGDDLSAALESLAASNNAVAKAIAASAKASEANTKALEALTKATTTKK